MADDSDPPRVFYQLKPREFERVNAVTPPPPPVDLPTTVSQTPDTSARIEVQKLVAQASVPGPILAPGQKAVVKNEVHGILEENLSRANAAGLNTITPKPRRRSRRTRDYFFVVIPLDAFFGFAAFGPYANPVSFIYGIAGLIFVTIGIGWVMFFVMDDY